MIKGDLYEFSRYCQVLWEPSFSVEKDDIISLLPNSTGDI